MSVWWIADGEGRVLGPIGPEVVRELWTSQRIGPETQVSRNGQGWIPITQVPELTGASESPTALAERQRQEAGQLKARLEELRSKRPHEVFGVPESAPAEHYREAFFRISKRFHPERLPETIVPELRDASTAVFRFLSGLLTRLENDRKRPATPPPIAPRAAPVREVAPRPAPVPPPPSVEDRYGPETFVGLRPVPGGEYEASIQVSARTVSIFYEHPLANLRQCGMFIPGKQVLPLGTRLQVKLEFDDPPRTLHIRGHVTFECAQGKGPHGFGVMLNGLGKEDRAFVEAYVAQNRAKAAQASTVNR